MSNNKDVNQEIKSERDGYTDIAYKGSVVIKYVNKKGKQRIIKKHNSGKLGLFKFILYCLAADPKHPDQNTYFPVSLMCYSTPSTDPSAKNYGSANKCLTNTQPYKATPYVELLANPQNPKITYCFDIPNNDIIKSTNSSISRLVLVNQKYNSNASSNPEDSICAEIDLKPTETIQTDTPGNIVIYWTLSFRNADNSSKS